MGSSDDSTQLGTAEALFHGFLGSGAADFTAFVDTHPEHREELEDLHATWQAIEARRLPRDEHEIQMGASRYRSLAEIGRGGMGIVYRARDDQLGRDVAFKIQLGESGKNPERPERFYTEARINAQLDHPGVVPVHELGRDQQGNPFFTMRFVEGATLQRVFEWVREERDDWSLTRALGVLSRVCETIAFAHSRHIVHRDLKPQNIMVGRFGEVYVMDWGVAKVLRESGSRKEPDDSEPDEPEPNGPDESGLPNLLSSIPAPELLTSPGSVLGTPSYMAPEQAHDSARVDPRADVYALGAILYELLSGQHPYRDREVGTSVLEALQASEPTPLSKLDCHASPELVAICNKAMARYPDRRYGSAAELRRDLTAFLEQRVVNAYRTGFWSELGKWYERNRRQAQALTSGVLIAVVSLTLGYVLQKRANTELQGTNERLDAALRSTEKREYSINMALAQQLLRAGDARSAGQRLHACPAGLRGWEWEYLNARLDSRMARLDTYSTGITAMSYDALGQRVFCGTQYGNLLIHDLTGVQAEDVVMYSDRGRVSSLTPDVNRPGALITGHAEGTIVRWDIALEVELERWVVADSLSALAMASDGRLAVGAEGVVQLRSGQALELDRTFVAHENPVTFLSWSPSEELLASAGHDGTVAIWDAATTELVARFAIDDPAELGRHPSQVRWSADGTRLAAAFPTGVWCVFDTVAQREIARVRTEYWTYAVAFLDNETLVVGGNDVLETWDVSSETRVRRWPGADVIVDIQFADTSLFVLERERGISQFPLEESHNEVLVGHREDVTSIAVQPGGGLVASASRDGTAGIWDPSTGERLATFDEWPVIRDSVAWASAGIVLTGHPDGSVAEWDVETGALSDRWSFGQHPVRALCTSSDGRYVAVEDLRGKLRVWDREARELVAELEVAKQWFKPSFSADGSRLAVVDGSRRGIAVYSVPDFKIVEERSDVHTDRIKSLAFSSDGTYIVSASEDQSIGLWHPDMGSLRMFRGHAHDAMDAIFIEGDTRIASCDIGRQIRIWDVESGDSLLTLFGHKSWVLDLEYDPVARVLVSSSSDRTVRLWRPTAP